MIENNEQGLHHIDNSITEIRNRMIEEAPNSQLEGSILKLKTLFEARILEVNENIIRTNEAISDRSREIKQDGSEILCQAIREETREQQTQNAQIRNMLEFISMNANAIRELITQNNRQEQFEEYVGRETETHERGIEQMDLQRRALFEKVEENRTKLEIMEERIAINNENQIRTMNNQGIIIKTQAEDVELNRKNQIIAINNQEVIIESQNRIEMNQVMEIKYQEKIIEIQEKVGADQQQIKKSLELIKNIN
jgi:hypothetical protein